FGRLDAVAAADTLTASTTTSTTTTSTSSTSTSTTTSTSPTSTSTTTTSTSSTSTSTLPARCTSDDECADDDACTVGVAAPERGCVSPPAAGIDGPACLFTQLGAPDVCGPGEIDAKTGSLIANRVASAQALLAKATQASKPAARAAALRKIARK